MRRTASLRTAAVAALATSALLLPALQLPASAAELPTLVDPVLIQQLLAADADDQIVVGAHGATLSDAKAAFAATGVRFSSALETIDVAIGVGSKRAVEALKDQPHLIFLEAQRELSPALDTAHQATRADVARTAFLNESNKAYDGTGISIAVVDTGIDGTHPFFRLPDGSSKVVASLKNVCPAGLNPEADSNADICMQPTDPANDTDNPSMGGHGTHVAGIAAGVPTTTTSPRVVNLQGSAPGAKLVSLSTGATLVNFSADHAFNWLIAHHAAPCGAGVSAAVCPPVKVVNNSFGPLQPTAYSENTSTVRLQRRLVSAGVTFVWAAGNSGGNGSEAIAETNDDAQDPTPGVIMVANYDDGGTGTRDGVLASDSSRGRTGVPSTYPDLSAPGSLITSSCRPSLPICSSGVDPVDGPGETDIGTFNTISGTSMATPYIAGVIAVLLDADPLLTPSQLEDILEDTAYKFGSGYENDPRNPDDSTSFDKGHGLVDVAAALARVLSLPDPGAGGGVTCPSDAAFTDPTGDGGTPSNPALDIVASHLSTQVPAGTITFHLDLMDLTAPSAGVTQGFIYRFTYKSKDYYVEADRSTDLTQYLVGDFSGAQGSRISYKEISGSFDDTNDRITIVLGFDDLGLTSPIGVGDVLSGLEPSSGSQIGHPDVGSVTPTADSATDPCPYTVGAAALEPVVPEVPVGVVLPLLAAALLGSAYQVARRRTAA